MGQCFITRRGGIGDAVKASAYGNTIGSGNYVRIDFDTDGLGTDDVAICAEYYYGSQINILTMVGANPFSVNKNAGCNGFLVHDAYIFNGVLNNHNNTVPDVTASGSLRSVNVLVGANGSSPIIRSVIGVRLKRGS